MGNVNVKETGRNRDCEEMCDRDRHTEVETERDSY